MILHFHSNEMFAKLTFLYIYFKQAGGAAAAAGEVNKKLTDVQRQLET